MADVMNPHLVHLLDRLVEDVEGVCAAVVSTDGLIIQRSSGLSKNAGDQLAAQCSGLASLSRAITQSEYVDGGPVQQTMIEMQDRILFIISAGQNACLVLLTPAEDVNLGNVAFSMTRIVAQVGRHLSAEQRVVTGYAPSS
ncbi:roadblock/LC7 domain-containing protein [Actinocatenispora sera]|uniref:Dynein regulation protein LC7 n=1 Tax=Actinocatenispora sera TaxID=390989 RepID=A0A810KWD6_9ACTN|nr:roadblock/LC7 domain-containing protein [Actinocatenispora sera]BCJ26659.1 dynein regulation protein LC7 [Actinocatenispora sera]